MNTTWYSVKGNGKEFYCKLLTISYGEKSIYSLSVGGKKEFCVTIAIKSDDIAYIDRVEYSDFCVKDGVLAIEGGMVIILSVSLWVVKQLFPTIKIFTLTDDSHILCIRKQKQYKLSLANDYIIKYGKTWYENKFNAILPDEITPLYKKSQEVLDLPIDPFEYQRDRAVFLTKYENTYRTAGTPREFITMLRSEYGDRYCIEVGLWLTRYMELLNVKIFKDSWMIPASSLSEPEGYELTKVDISQDMGGGLFRISKRTRKIRNKDGFSIGYWNPEGNY